MNADLRSELLKVRRDRGELTSQTVVDAARPPEHPLHSRFEWDDAAAGESWRLHQAAELIRSVRITYKEPDESGPARTIRAFHSIPTGTGFVYEPAEEIAEDPLRRKMLLASMEREWRALHRRYEEFSEFAEMVRRDIGNAEPMAA